MASSRSHGLDNYRELDIFSGVCFSSLTPADTCDPGPYDGLANTADRLSALVHQVSGTCSNVYRRPGCGHTVAPILEPIQRFRWEISTENFV